MGAVWRARLLSSEGVGRFFALMAAIALGCGASTQPSTPGRTPLEAPPAKPNEPAAEPEPRESSPDCPEGMVPVPGGMLERGSKMSTGLRELVPVAAFCLDAHEVTVGEYEVCQQNRACTPLSRGIGNPNYPERSKLCSAQLNDNADLPATCVSHEDATRYCAWKEHRLPSQTEFEWAATGGNDKLEWPWGDDPPSHDKACFEAKKPCRVKSKPAGAFGLYDLVGGVAEWTSTFEGEYPGTTIYKGGSKVVVGKGQRWQAVLPGSWQATSTDDLRPLRRTSYLSEARDPMLGFRCAANR